MRTPRRLLAPVAAAAALSILLTGCSAEPPGAAAVVDGEAISQSTANEFSEVLCPYFLLTTQQPTLDNAAVQLETISRLVLLRVGNDLVAERDIDVPSTTVDPQLVDALDEVAPDLDPEAVDTVLTDIERLNGIIAAVGTQALGDGAQTADPTAVQQSGVRVLQEAAQKADVRYAPRYGIGDDGVQTQLGGSLSVPTTQLQAPPTDLPATQQCAATQS